MIIALITVGLLLHFTSSVSIVHPLSWILQDRDANLQSKHLERKPTYKIYKHHKEYAIGSFRHVDKPFTQGLTIRTNNCTSPGKELDKCLHHQTQAKCYQDTLHKCGVSLYESAGLYGQSKVLKITNFDTGKPDYSMTLPPYIFAEGLQYIPNKDMLVLGSWREQLLFLINDTGSSFVPIHAVRTENLLEHWGVTVIGNKILATSGEDKLFTIDLPLWIDQKKFSINNVTMLRCNNSAVHQVNELEFDSEHNSIWGNIWLEDSLMEFDYDSGQCKGFLDLTFLNKMETRRHRDAVWNGIASLGNDWMFLTGKLFANIYLLKLQ